MQTVVGVAGKKKTTINKGDRNAIDRVMAMCDHCAANLEEIPAAGAKRTKDELMSLLSHLLGSGYVKPPSLPDVKANISTSA